MNEKLDVVRVVFGPDTRPLDHERTDREHGDERTGRGHGAGRRAGCVTTVDAEAGA